MGDDTSGPGQSPEMENWQKGEATDLSTALAKGIGGKKGRGPNSWDDGGSVS